MPDTKQPQDQQKTNLPPLTVAEEIYVRNRELLQERRRVEEFLYNVSEGVLAVNKTFEITIFNETIGKMLAIPVETAMGKNIKDILRVETQEGQPIDLTSYLFQQNEEKNSLSEVVLLSPKKNFFVNVKFSSIESESGEKNSECLVTISDITKEITLDKAKDEFISIASHELKSPMTVIKSYLWMLLNNQVGDLTAEQIQYLQVAYRSTDHLISLINDMLNISRMDQGKLTFKCIEQNVISSVSSAIAEYDVKAREKNIYLKKDFTKVSPDITAYYDEDRFKECVVNLVSNAIKFTKEGGVTISLEADNDFVKVVIADTGVGISENDAKNLFKKFGKGENSYQKSEVTGGTGLGLYIVKMYIEAMGGNIGYTSQGDFKGTTFWLTVPKSQKIY